MLILSQVTEQKQNLNLILIYIYFNFASSLWLFQSNLIMLLYIWANIIYVHHMHANAGRDQRVQNPQEMKLQAVFTSLVWVQKIKPGPLKEQKKLVMSKPYQFCFVNQISYSEMNT